MKADNTQIKSEGMKSQKPMHDRAVKHLANNIYKQLENEGCHHKDIIGISSQLISLVTNKLQEENSR